MSKYLQQVPWRGIHSGSDWENVLADSFTAPVLVFKHSSRCGISHMALERLDNQWPSHPLEINPYLLDLLANREVSNRIATELGVLHQSPQIILIHAGICVFTTSHNAISAPIIVRAVDQLSANN